MPAEGARELPRLLYLLNGFDNGGAEWAAPTLVRGGLFAGFDLKIAALARGAGAQLETLSGLGVDTQALTPGRLSLASLPRAALALHGLLHTFRPQALVLSLPQANLLGRALRSGRRPPLVISFEHNSHLAKRIYERGWRATSGRVDWMLADCQATATAATARLYRRPPPRTDIVPLVGFGALSDPAPIRRGPPWRLVSAARLTPPKNQRLLIEIVAALRQRGLDVQATLYGEGPEHSALTALAAALGISDHVRLPGRVQRWWAEGGADVFILTSRHEGLCIAVLEAMAAGLPCASTPVGGLLDYGPEAKALRLADTPGPAADQRAALLASPSERAAMAEAGRGMITRRYANGVNASRYHTLNAKLRAAVAARHSPPR